MSSAPPPHPSNGCFSTENLTIVLLGAVVALTLSVLCWFIVRVKREQESTAFKEISWAIYRANTSEEIIKLRSECVICKKDFNDEDECKLRSKCNHIFHKTCIDRWLLKRQQCPFCRGSVPSIVRNQNEANY